MRKRNLWWLVTLHGPFGTMILPHYGTARTVLNRAIYLRATHFHYTHWI